MLKRKSTSKKKKTHFGCTSYPYYQEKSDKNILKFTTAIVSPKPTLNQKISQLTKVTKSTNITPSSKSRKQSKENIYQSPFYSSKSSAIVTPFQFVEEAKKVKSRNDYRFLYQVGSGGFGRVWKVEDKKEHCIYAMKEMSKAK